MVRLLCDADGNRDVYSLCCLCKNLIAIRLLNGDLWPTGFPSALGVRDSLPVNKSAVIRGYKTGAISFGLENAPGTYYQRLQINPNGTVVYYYLPEGATTLKTATLVHLEDLL